MSIHRETPYRGDWDRLLPVTNMVTDTTLILPLFHEMTDEDQGYVIDCIEQISGLRHDKTTTTTNFPPLYL